MDYYDQADQLFYSNRNTTKEALRNKYAEMLDNIAHAALAAAQTPKDYEAVSEIIAKARKSENSTNRKSRNFPPPCTSDKSVCSHSLPKCWGFRP